MRRFRRPCTRTHDFTSFFAGSASLQLYSTGLFLGIFSQLFAFSCPPFWGKDSRAECARFFAERGAQ